MAKRWRFWRRRSWQAWKASRSAVPASPQQIAARSVAPADEPAMDGALALILGRSLRDVLSMQQLIGNQVVGRILSPAEVDYSRPSAGPARRTGAPRWWHFWR